MEGYFVNQEMRFDPVGDDDLLVFLHGQRTGGSAFRAKVLCDIFSRDSIYAFQYVDNWKKWFQLDDRDIDGYDVFVGHNDFYEKEIKRKTRFITIMRHPFYRFVSLYGYVENTKTSPYRLEWELAQGEMVDFFKNTMAAKSASGKNTGMRYVSNLLCRRICGYPDFEAARHMIEGRYFAVGCMEKMSTFADFIAEFFQGPIKSLERIDSDYDRYGHLLDDEKLVSIVLDNNHEDEKLFWYLNQNYFGLPVTNYPWTEGIANLLPNEPDSDD